MLSKKTWSKIGLWAGGLQAAALFSWSLLGNVQRARGLAEDREWWWGVVTSPLTGLAVAIASLVTFLVVRKHDDAYPASAPKPEEPQAVTPPKLTMKGKFFHTMKDGKIDYQGYVLRDEGGNYFVQILSFYDGYPSSQRYLTATESQTVRFYDTNEQMLDAYYKAHPEIDRGLDEFARMKLDDDD